MSQRTKIISEIWGYRGWKVTDIAFVDDAGQPVEPVRGSPPGPEVIIVIRAERRWARRCAECSSIGHACHERLPVRSWDDLSMSGHRVRVEYAPERVKCKRCKSTAVERLAFADPHQRQTQRLQQHLALDAFSMPILHVATKYGLGWHTVRRAEVAAIARWEMTRPPIPLRLMGLDEKYLGRRNKLGHKYVTIVSNLESGEPVWIGYGRREETVAEFLAPLSAPEKATIELVAMDMHRPFWNAIKADPDLAHVVIAHDPFHIMKRGGKAMDEIRREVFFRAGNEMRRLGRGTRWLVLRSWERCTENQKTELAALLRMNGRLARAYQTLETLRAAVVESEDGAHMEMGLRYVLRRTQNKKNVPMRKLHESLKEHWNEIVALGEHRPPAGRIEALNNNWETLVRQGRGYRDHEYLLRKLRFRTANPVRTANGIKRFIALGLPAPTRVHTAKPAA